MIMRTAMVRLPMLLAFCQHSLPGRISIHRYPFEGFFFNMRALKVIWLPNVLLAFFVSSSTFHVVADQPAILRQYPCGPDSLTGPIRRLIPQGAFGADFKPACRQHDACYDTPYSDRDQCDRDYLLDMNCACEKSKHPFLCKMVARALYNTTHRHGQKAFDSAQTIAIAKLQQ
jgi:hypothetical protein